MKIRMPAARTADWIARKLSSMPTSSATCLSRGHRRPPSERKSLYGSTNSSAVFPRPYSFGDMELLPDGNALALVRLARILGEQHALLRHLPGGRVGDLV